MIDRSLLPPSALIDTGVLFRFLGDQPFDKDSPACVDFCNEMIGEGRTLYVAAPTIAEVTRHRGKKVPHRKGIVVVPFDDKAAEILGLEMTMARIHSSADSTGCSRTYLKYDAMIVACALRAKTKIIVALDGDHTKLAGSLSVSVRHPKEFRAPNLFEALERLQDTVKAGG